MFMVLAVAVLVIWAVSLCWWDLRARRLPNWLTLPAGAVALLAIVFQPAWAVGLVWPAVYLAQALIPGPVGSLGGGDIKLALPLGVVCAAGAGSGGVLVAMALAGLVTVSAGLLRRSPDRRSIAHGPAMVCAAAVVVLGWAAITPIR